MRSCRATSRIFSYFANCSRLFGLEELIACWEAILLHIELWSKVARRRDREDIVRLLHHERAEAAAALARAHEDLEKAENEGYERKEREIYGFMSGGIS